MLTEKYCEKNVVENNFSSAVHLMKFLGCFAVILIHSCMFDYKEINNQWWALNFYNAISRFAVPLFIMVSGALLINKKYSPREFLIRRMVRIIPALLFWSNVYLFWLGDSRFLEVTSIKMIISGPVYYHLWYLYAIIGILLISPILTIFYFNSSQALKLYFLSIWFISYSIYPVIKEIFQLQRDLISTYELHPFFGLIGWYFLGGFLRDLIVTEEQSSLFYLLFFLISTTLIMLATYCYSSKLITYDYTGITSPLFFERNSPLVVISTVSLFVFLSKINIKKNLKFYKIVKHVASLSLGIYCLHLIILHELYNIITNYFDNRWVSIPSLATVVFILSILIINMLYKIKIFRYVL